MKYECHVGYTAIGDTEFICLQNNTWLSRSQNTRTMPVCSKNVESNGKEWENRRVYSRVNSNYYTVHENNDNGGDDDNILV